ncbi:MAG: OmpA family protein, partial [Saprospiraceae bacterium]|nr:OmpA family protein [Saprospiraceae bacterium]
GDLDFVPSWGAGIHLRKAIDYVFSVRGEAFTGKLEQKNNIDGTSESNVQTGSLQLMVSINNLVWNNVPRRKTNLYAFVGGGITRFEVAAVQSLSSYLNTVEPTVQTHLDGGVGIAFRLSNRFNLGLEAKALTIFGHDADLLDGVARRENDVMGYGSVRLNFNLGNSNTKAEPLYWVNPMDIIMQDITELKNRPVFDHTDSDADGVIDPLDQDNATPPGVVVDTRGLPLDSDGDGTPNFQDDEPYLPKGSKVVTRQEGQTPVTNEEDVRKLVQDEIDNYINNNSGKTGNNGTGKTDDGKTGKTDDGRTGKTDDNKTDKTDDSKTDKSGSTRKGLTLGGGGITDWFLPIVHFNIDSPKIRYAEYGSLASVAHVMKANPDLSILVTGFTDKTASDQYNLDLSYQRAKAVIEHLVSVHGIARSRLLLNYNGEDYPLVPSTGSTLMNRRVEFRVANDEDVEMENPAPAPKKNGKKDGF